MSDCENATECNSGQGSEDRCEVMEAICSDINPIASSINLWKKGFFRAMHEAQVDVLKEKMRKEWGPVFDKQADAVLRSMGTQWQSLLDQAKAKEDLREAFERICNSQHK